MGDRFPGLQSFLGLPGMFAMQRSMSRLAPDSPARAKAFEEMDPVRAATAFGALLTVPELQSNTARLEMLVHQALALGRGGKKPSDQWVAAQFRDIGRGVAGRLEDPAEDVLVTYCTTSMGGFRVLEGIWECAGFNLQRVVNVVEGMPSGGRFDRLRANVFALLRLSELMCGRAGLSRYELGGGYPEASLPRSVSARLASLRRRIRFTFAELAEAGVSRAALATFVFPQGGQGQLLDGELGHTALERRPLIAGEDEVVLVLPTAVSAAIRRLVVETVDDMGQREAFLAHLCREYLDLVENVPLLGGRLGARLHFHRSPTAALAGGTVAIDQGRYLNLVLLLDTLEDFESTGLVGCNPDSGQVTGELQEWFSEAYAHAKADPDFVDGLTLLVSCGVGRASAHAIPKFAVPDWRVETLSAADFHTLSWTHEFKPLSLWRMLDGQAALERVGVRLQNINGLLNLAASVRAQDGHMVPHRDIPDEFADRSRTLSLMLPQNALRALRHEVALDYDVHVRPDVHGRYHPVRRLKDRLFAEDDARPIYVSDEVRERRGSAGIYVSAARDWWFDVVVPDDLGAGPAHDYWLTLMTWLVRSAPVLERRLPRLPPGPILVEVDFTGAAGATREKGESLAYEEVRAGLSFALDASAPIVRIAADEAFEQGGFNVENVAEQALVGAILDGVAAFAGVSLDPNETLVLIREISPDSMARQRHVFAQAKFHDLVRDDLPATPLVIDRGDEALHRLDLGWRSRDRADDPWIRDKSECLAFLNSTTQVLEDELRTELRAFDRAALVKILLYHHEAAAADARQWKRTAGAILALREDKDAVRAVMTDRGAERAELSQTARTLVELALCEAPLGGGRRPGELDLSRLLAKMSLLLTFSGWSGAIRWDVMEPTLKVAPLGDILGRLDFIDDILHPFARAFSDVGVDSAVKRYGENLRDTEVMPTVELPSDAKFYSALQEEVGASFDDYRLFIDCVENLGVRAGKAVLTLNRSALIGLSNEDRTLSEESSEDILEALTLAPRGGWREDADGIDPKDLQLWRYRRRLSVLRKPLIQIDHADDPAFVVAPGLLRQGFLYTVGNFYDGSFPDWQLSKPMKSWQAKIADARGRAFTVLIGDRLRAAGWTVAESDLKVTKLLGKGFDVDHGDVDVLAWRPETGRVLVIECKDVQFKKSVGEVAEQLADFRGEVTDGKRDYLRKHLDRMAHLREHLPEVARFIGWDAVGELESHLVFKNPVPVQFALDRLRSQVRVSTGDTLLRTLAE